ncbi:MAG: MBL fold metallo-hydrolase [Dehalococcoidia bacterium]|nr:MBL fold metallo-hydrolase [Dehalococcoidia bacterium]
MKIVNGFHAYLWPGVTMSEMRVYGNNCNSYLVSNALPGGRHILVDPGMIVNEAGQNCLERLIGEMAKDEFRIEDIGLILNTHAHPDHYGASEEIRRLSGAQVAIGKGDDEFLKLAEGEMGKMMKQMGFEMPEINPDFYLTEGELRFNENLTAEILVTPGHSAGHISIYWPDEKVFMGGDLIFYGSTGRVDIPGGSALALKQSIERVAEMDIEYVLTGHQYGSPGIIAGKEEIEKNFDFIRKHIYPYL